MKKFKLIFKPILGTLIINGGVAKEGKDYIYNKKTNTIIFSKKQASISEERILGCKISKVRKILEWLITEDDKGRHKINYDVGKTIDKAEKKISNLKLKDLK